MPLDTAVAAHSVAVPSLNVTVPVAEDGVTDAVKITDCPSMAGLWEADNAVEVAMVMIVPLTICVAVCAGVPLSVAVIE